MISSLLRLGHFFSTHPLTRDAPLSAWKRFVWWQIESRMHAEISFQWIGGQRLVVRRGMTGATGNIYTGLHEFTDMMVALHFLRERDLFFDVGANIGSYTILASGVRRAITWAFEPDPETVRHLKRNVSINALDGAVTVRECALGAVQSRVRFTVGCDTTNRVAGHADGATREVAQETLDGVSADLEPIMMKIDVEGYEEQVLQGATRLLSTNSLKIIAIETVTPWISDILRANGFENLYYDPFTRKLSSMPSNLPSSNLLFVRDQDFVAERMATAETLEILGRQI